MTLVIYIYFKAGKELLITTVLEFLTFHPLDQKMTDKFTLKVIEIENESVFWCSFPKEFKQVCKNVAETFEMKMNVYQGMTIQLDVEESIKLLENSETSLEESLFGRNHHTQPEPAIRKDAIARIVAPLKKKTIYTKFPARENILWFEGRSCDDHNRIMMLQDNIIFFGNSLHKLGIG